jgi:hypothetical protein
MPQTKGAFLVMNIAEFICSGYGMGKGLLIFVLGAHSLNCKSTTWLPLYGIFIIKKD